MRPQAYEYKGPCNRYIFSLAKRHLQSGPIWSDLLNILESKEFLPDQPFEIVIGLCPLGLKEARAIDWTHFRRVCADLFNLNPSAPMRLVSHEELRGL